MRKIILWHIPTMNGTHGQLVRFAVVGVMNTGVDFAVLNSLVFMFGLERNDPKYALFKAISFFAAVANSFIFNKLWVFRTGSWRSLRLNAEVASFLAISGVGLLINVAASFVVFNLGHEALPSLSTAILANIGAVAGSIAAMATNFLGYKHIVFRRSRRTSYQS
jgi:putative flippase GtrA